MKKSNWLLVFLIYCILSKSSFALVLSVYLTNPHAVTTYECAGIYWKTGEFETALPPMQFGRRAYLNYNKDRALRELY